MSRFEVGQKVQIKGNAYGDSLEPEDTAVRGKIGYIEREPSYEGGHWTVHIPGNIGHEYLFDNEIEAVQP